MGDSWFGFPVGDTKPSQKFSNQGQLQQANKFNPTNRRPVPNIKKGNNDSSNEDGSDNNSDDDSENSDNGNDNGGNNDDYGNDNGGNNDDYGNDNGGNNDDYGNDNGGNNDDYGNDNGGNDNDYEDMYGGHTDQVADFGGMGKWLLVNYYHIKTDCLAALLTLSIEIDEASPSEDEAAALKVLHSIQGKSRSSSSFISDIIYRRTPC